VVGGPRVPALPSSTPEKRTESARWPTCSFYCLRVSCERAKEILVRAASTDDREAQGMMRVVAAGYEKLARRVEQRVHEANTEWPATQPEAADLLNVSGARDAKVGRTNA
jgi:hypothetical protein